MTKAAEYPAKTTSIQEVHPWPSTYHHASILASSELLCPALALIEKVPRKYTFPVKTSRPRQGALAIEENLVKPVSPKSRLELSRSVVFGIELLKNDKGDAIARLKVTAVEKQHKKVLFAIDLSVDECFGGDVQSVFMYVILPLFRELKPSLLVGIVVLTHETSFPLVVHTLQWIDAQLNALAEHFTSKRFLSVILFKNEFPPYLNLDSAAMYATIGDGLVVGFPECECWRWLESGWRRRPACSSETAKCINLWRVRHRMQQETPSPLGGVAPSIGDLFREVSSKSVSPAGAAQQRALWELSGGFSPLGGHLMSWVYSPRTCGTSLIVKKTSLTEGAFYSFIASQLRRQNFGLHQVLRELSPETWASLPGNHIERQLGPLAPFLPVVSDIHAEGANCYVEMENLLHTDIGTSPWRPAYCAMDLKIGTRLWGLDADETKRKRMEDKARTTTAGSTGLCLIAYRSVSAETGRIIANVSREQTKKILTEDGLKSHLEAFFSLASLQTVQSVYSQVCGLRDWFRHQTLIHFHSSSLFIIYDSRSTTHDGARTVVKLIDFAHASFFHSGVDASSLYGLNRLVMYLEELMTRIS